MALIAFAAPLTADDVYDNFFAFVDPATTTGTMIVSNQNSTIMRIQWRKGDIFHEVGDYAPNTNGIAEFTPTSASGVWGNTNWAFSRENLIITLEQSDDQKKANEGTGGKTTGIAIFYEVLGRGIDLDMISQARRVESGVYDAVWLNVLPFRISFSQNGLKPGQFQYDLTLNFSDGFLRFENQVKLNRFSETGFIPVYIKSSTTTGQGTNLYREYTVLNLQTNTVYENLSPFPHYGSKRVFFRKRDQLYRSLGAAASTPTDLSDTNNFRLVRSASETAALNASEHAAGNRRFLFILVGINLSVLWLIFRKEI